jgi:hypothetical protein
MRRDFSASNPAPHPLRRGEAERDGAQLPTTTTSGCGNDRIKRELGVRLAFPDYRAGLAAILEAEKKI